MSWKKNIKLILAVSALNAGTSALASTTTTPEYDFEQGQDDVLSQVLIDLSSDTQLMGHDKGHQKTHDKDHAKGGW